MCFILLGDLGGTNIRLYLIESDYALKNFHCKLSVNYLQRTPVTINGQPAAVETYSDFSQALHDFLAEYSEIFKADIQNKPEPERNFIMGSPEYVTYLKRTVSPEGEVRETETKYLKFWTGEAIDSKDPNAKFFRLFAAVAIAGNPVDNKIKKFANINWGPIDGNLIRDSFGLSCFYMLNDFHANGFGVLSLKENRMDLVNRHVVKSTLKSIRKRQRRLRDKQRPGDSEYMSSRLARKKELTMLMGMGTGLGVCGIVTKGKVVPRKGKKSAKQPKPQYINLFLNQPDEEELKMQIDRAVYDKDLLVMPSEGGHVGLPFFESKDEFDIGFQKFVKEKHGFDFNFASQEALYCGKSIDLLYQFICRLDFPEVQSTPTAAEVFQLALDKEPTAVKTFEKFLEYLGASVFTVNVMFSNQDKLILMGNIINKVLRQLYEGREKEFWALVSRRLYIGRHFKEMLQKLKVFVYDDQDVMGISGIFNYLYLSHIKPGH